MKYYTNTICMSLAVSIKFQYYNLEWYPPGAQFPADVCLKC